MKACMNPRKQIISEIMLRHDLHNVAEFLPVMSGM